MKTSAFRGRHNCCTSQGQVRASAFCRVNAVPKLLPRRFAFGVIACVNATRPTAGRQGIRRPDVKRHSAAKPAATEDDVVRYAAAGDIVSIHFIMRGEDGQVIQSSATDLGEPLSFEVGAGEMMGNRLFQGFDEAVRGMAVGQTTVLEASGGEWRRELLFSVPRDHPEVQRLEGRYKNHGGLAPGLVVELSNGAMAVILEADDAVVKLDANNMLAGKSFTIELELLSIDNAPPKSAAPDS